MYPDWLRPWSRTAEQTRAALREHVHTVAGRYRGRVDASDAVVEALSR